MLLAVAMVAVVADTEKRVAMGVSGQDAGFVHQTKPRNVGTKLDSMMYDEFVSSLLNGSQLRWITGPTYHTCIPTHSMLLVPLPGSNPNRFANPGHFRVFASIHQTISKDITKEILLNALYNN